MAERTQFGWEKLRAILAEPNFRDMIETYYEELSPLKGAAPLAPDWDEMMRREDAGVFCVWAARVNRTLAGFISFHLTPHLNYRDTLFAIDAGHFLAPEFRDHGALGLRMWRSAEAGLRERGARVVVAHDNAQRSLLPFFLHLGYKPRSTIYMKVV